MEYYSRYLDDYEHLRGGSSSDDSGGGSGSSSNSSTLVGPLETSILMDDIMNNGMTCSIM